MSQVQSVMYAGAITRTSTNVIINIQASLRLYWSVFLRREMPTVCCCFVFNYRTSYLTFLADRTNGRAYATVLRPSASPSVTLCTVAKRCVLEHTLLLTAKGKSHMRNRLITKWMTLTFV